MRQSFINTYKQKHRDPYQVKMLFKVRLLRTGCLNTSMMPGWTWLGLLASSALLSRSCTALVGILPWFLKAMASKVFSASATRPWEKSQRGLSGSVLANRDTMRNHLVFFIVQNHFISSPHTHINP